MADEVSSELEYCSLDGSSRPQRKSAIKSSALIFEESQKVLGDFIPNKSVREIRKTKKKQLIKSTVDSARVYDDRGCFMDTGDDLCDCLEPLCPGCHFRCNKCDSRKCGTECRCNRKYEYDNATVEGADKLIRNERPRV